MAHFHVELGIFLSYPESGGLTLRMSEVKSPHKRGAATAILAAAATDRRGRHLDAEDHDTLRLGVDTGGTFTDFVCLRADRLEVYKCPSTPQDPSQAILDGIKLLA